MQRRIKERNPKVDKAVKHHLDLGVAYEDELVQPKEFVDFLRQKLKVNGVAGNLGEDVTVTSSGQKVTVTSNVRLSKRYLKYLTKKYLKKIDILEYLKVIASDKNTYRVKYIKLEQDDEEAS